MWEEQRAEVCDVPQVPGSSSPSFGEGCWKARLLGQTDVMTVAPGRAVLLQWVTVFRSQTLSGEDANPRVGNLSLGGFLAALHGFLKMTHTAPEGGPNHSMRILWLCARDRHLQPSLVASAQPIKQLHTSKGC